MKTKRILSVILAFAMIISTMCFPAFAEDVIIKTTDYATFKEAMNAANTAGSSVVVEIYDSVEFTDGMELKGGYASITFVGKADDAKITINQTPGGDYLEAHGKKVAFTDLTLAKANPGHHNNSGHMGNYFSIQGGEATYTNCIFLNGACTSTGTAVYDACTFQNTAEYGLWVYDDAYVTVNGGTIDSAKGIKVYSEDETSVTSALTVQNATFTENVTKKPAVAIGYAEAITLLGNTYNNQTGVLELDSGSDGNCNGIAFVAEDAEGNDITSTLTAVDRSNGDARCGAFVTNANGETEIYVSVTEAAKVAKDGDTVTFLYDTEEEVLFEDGVVVDDNNYEAPNTAVDGAIVWNNTSYSSLQAAIDAIGSTKGDHTIYLKGTISKGTKGGKPGEFTFQQIKDVNITIDGQNETTFTGTIGFNGAAREDGKLTIQNIAFKTTNTTHNFIEASTTNYYPSDVLIQNCKFEGPENNVAVVAVNLKAADGVKITNCTGKNLHSFLQNTAGWDLDISNITVEASEGGFNLGTVQGVKLTNINVTANDYGFRMDANGNGHTGIVEITDCSAKAYIPVYVRKATTTTGYTVEIEGENTFTPTNSDGLAVVVNKEKDCNETTAPIFPDVDIKVETTDKKIEENMFGVRLDGFVYDFDGLNAAIAAGETAVLGKDITATQALAISSDAKIDLNGKKLTVVGDNKINGGANVTISNGTIDITGAVADGDAIFGIGSDTATTVTLNNVDVIGDGYSSAYAVFYLYDKGSELNVNGGSIVVSNDTAGGGGVIKVNNTTNGKVNITGTETDPVELNFTDAKIGFLDGTVKFNYVDLDITGGANAINGSALTAKNSTLTIKDCDGRALTVNQDNVVIENSTLDFSGATEGEIRFKKALELSLDKDSTLNKCEVYADTSAAGAKVNDKAVAGTEDEKSTVIVTNGSATVVNPRPSLEGEGTEASPYLINNLEDLLWFASDVNGGNTYDKKYVKLTANIDLANMDWTPIGNTTTNFKGYFDGNDKTISNLNVTGNNDHVGFFGYIRGTGMTETAIPTVQKLTLKDVSVQGDYYVGALAGQGYICKVSNVTVSGKVSGTRYVGGLIGHVYTYLENCHFVGDVSGTFDAIGGMAGAGDGRFYDCSVIGNVTGKNWVGGLIANGQEGTSAVGCYVKGTVSTSSNYYRGVGGIAGVGGHGGYSNTFKDNYFDGEVYLCGEKVDAIVTGIINADSNEDIKTTVEGNSWNTEYYPADTPVLVVAEVSKEATTEEWKAGAAENLTTERNNNLVMVESDLQYVDAENAEDVVIMKFSTVTEEQVEDAVIFNNTAVFIDADGDGVFDVDTETGYASLKEALDAATDGNVTLTLNDDVEWETGASHGSTPMVAADSKATVTIEGNGHKLTATGKGVGSIRAANGTLLTFNNVNIFDESVSYAEHAWEFTYLEFAGKLAFNNCTFNSGITVQSEDGEVTADAKFVDCTFITEEPSVYAVWVSDGSVEFTECEVTGTRGIKMHEAYGSAVDSVKIDNCTFEGLTEKPAVVIGDVDTETDVAISDCTINGVRKGDQGIYIIESDTPIDNFGFKATNNTVKIDTNNDGKYDDEEPIEYHVATDEAGVAEYLTLQNAVNESANGATIKLVDDLTNATKLTIDKNVTIDLAGKTLSLGQVTSTFALRATATNGGVEISHDVTFANGTVDLTGATGLFAISGANGKLTLEDVKLIGKDIIAQDIISIAHAGDGAEKVVLKNVDVDIDGHTFGDGVYFAKGIGNTITEKIYPTITVEDSDVAITDANGLLNGLNLNIKKSTFDVDGAKGHVLRKVSGTLTDTVVKGQVVKSGESFIKNTNGETLTFSGATQLVDESGAGVILQSDSKFANVSGFMFSKNIPLADADIATGYRLEKPTSGDCNYVVPEFKVSAVADKTTAVAGDIITVNVEVTGGDFTNAGWGLKFDSTKVKYTGSETVKNYVLSGKKLGSGSDNEFKMDTNGKYVVATYTFEVLEIDNGANNEAKFEIVDVTKGTGSSDYKVYVDNYQMAAWFNNVPAEKVNDTVKIGMKSDVTHKLDDTEVYYNGRVQQANTVELAAGHTDAEVVYTTNVFGAISGTVTDATVLPPSFQNVGTYQYAAIVKEKGYADYVIIGEMTINPLGINPTGKWNVAPEVNKVEFIPVLSGVLDGTYTGKVVVKNGTETIKELTAADFTYNGNGEAVYNGTPISITGVTSGLLELTVEYTSGGSADNYATSTGTADVDVSKSTAPTNDVTALEKAITGDGKNEFTYDGLAHTVEVKGTLPDGWTANIPTDTVTNVGDDKVVTVVFTNDKYNDVEIPVILKINPKKVTLRAVSKSKGIGEPDDLTYEVTPALVALGDLGNITVVRVAGQTGEKAGQYDITVNYTPNKNYEVFVVGGKLTIGEPKRMIEVVDNRYNDNKNLADVKADYANGSRMILVYTDADYAFFTYNGKHMYDVTDAGYEYFEHDYTNNSHKPGAQTKYKHVYAIVVDAEFGSEATEACEQLYANGVKFAGSDTEADYAPVKVTYDANVNEAVNGDELDENDYSTTNGVYNAIYDVDIKQISVLKADYTMDKIVNTADAEKVKAEVIK